jgi:hypothetical protein
MKWVQKNNFLLEMPKQIVRKTRPERRVFLREITELLVLG